MEVYGYDWPDNIYSARYLRVIDKAKRGRWDNYSGYMEKHHIIPVSMGGGNNKQNIVKLPGSLHYSAHYWLMKAFDNHTKEGRSMIAAFRKMNMARSYQDRPMKPKLYEEMRRRASEAGSGRKMSEENKKKLMEARRKKGYPASMREKISASRAGKPLTEAHRKKISEAMKGRKDSPETKEKRAQHHRGAKRSEETRARMKEGRRLAREQREKLAHTATL